MAYQYSKMVNITDKENRLFIRRYLDFLATLDYFLMHEQIDEKEEDERTVRIQNMLEQLSNIRLVADEQEDLLNKSLEKLLWRLRLCCKSTWRACLPILPSNFHVNLSSLDIIEKGIIFYYRFDSEVCGMTGILIEKPKNKEIEDSVWTFAFLTNLGEDLPFIYWMNNNKTFCLYTDKGEGDWLNFNNKFRFRRAVFFDVENGGTIKPCSYNAQTLKFLTKCEKFNQSIYF